MKKNPPNQYKDPIPLITDAYGDSQRFTNIFIWITFLITIGLILGIFIVLTTHNTFAAKVIAIGLLPVSLSFYLIRRQKIELASVLLLTSLISLNTLLATEGLGIHHISNLAYPAILIIASLVTSRRTMAFLTLFTLGCIGWLVFGELWGLYTLNVHTHSVPGDFIGTAIILTLTALIIRRLSESLFRNNIQLQRELTERKLAEESYRNIFENAIDGFFQTTTDGRFITVNPAMARIYGYESPEDMIQTITDIGSQLYVDPEQRKDLVRRMAEDEKIIAFETTDYRKDGSIIWTSTNARAIRDSYGNILYYEGIIEDITSRKEIELKRKEAETLYRTLVEQTSIVVYRDAPDEAGSGLYVSPQIETLLGYSVDEWLSEPTFWKKTIHSQDLSRVLADIKNYIYEKNRSSIEYRMLNKHGDWCWVRDEATVIKDEAGNAQFVQGVLIDITERKQAEAGLIQFRKLMDESNDAVFLIDPKTSVYIDFNKSAYEQLGYSREELSQLGTLDIAQHITSMEVWRERVDLVERNPNGLVFESVYKRKDGSAFPVEVSARMLDYQDQAIMIATVRDITQRKQAETALRASEQRFRKIFHSSPIAICITTIEEGRLLDANNAYWNITGYSPETSIGRNAEELKMWDLPEERAKFMIELREKQSISNNDDYFYHADGSLKNVMSFYEFILIGDQECVLAMFYDMSAQKQLEIEREKLISQLETQNAEAQNLRESFASIVGTFEFKEIIEKILDHIAHVIPYDSSSVWTVDGNLQKLITSRNLPPEHIIEEMEMKVDEINSAFPILRGEVPYVLNNNVQEELLDFKDPPHNIINSWLAIPLKVRGKVIGLIAIDGHRKNQFNEHHARLAVTFANQVAIALENSILVSDLQDELEARKNLIAELEIKNAESETLRESAAIVAATLERNEAIDRILEQLERVVPYNSASVQLLYDDHLEIVGGRGLPHLDENSMKFKIDSTEPSYSVLQGEVPYILHANVQPHIMGFTRPPHNRIHSWLAVPLRVKGTIIGIIALDGNTTNQFSERHAQLAVTYANQVAIALENARLFSELQNELFTREKLIKELESKNAELERFTYTVSHDLKSPLVTINGFMGYLENDMATGKAERIKVDITRIKDAVDKMHLLLKELLELSRIGRIVNTPEEIRFDDLVQGALELVHGQLASNKVAVHIDPNLPSVYGDRQRLIEVLQNLIDNAAKYIGNQPDPSIEIGQEGEDAENEQLIFFVKDNGIGISPEYHERIFGLFDKLDPKSDGTGVGLALVKRILEVHKGKIWVESEEGKGSTFYFTLPKNL